MDDGGMAVRALKRRAQQSRSRSTRNHNAGPGATPSARPSTTRKPEGSPGPGVAEVVRGGARDGGAGAHLQRRCRPCAAPQPWPWPWPRRPPWRQVRSPAAARRRRRRRRRPSGPRAYLREGRGEGAAGQRQRSGTQRRAAGARGRGYALGPARHHEEARGLPRAGPAEDARAGPLIGALVRRSARAGAHGLVVLQDSPASDLALRRSSTMRTSASPSPSPASSSSRAPSSCACQAPAR